MWTWVKEQAMNLIQAKYIASIVRGLLRALGGVIVGLGLGSEEVDQFIIAAEPVITGLLLILIGQILSFMDKAEKKDG